MLTYFEDFDLGKIYLLNYLVSWFENILMAYSYKHKQNNNCFIENFIIFYAVLSFLLSFLTEFFIVKKFFKKNDFDSTFDSVLNHSFKKTKIKFDSLFAS